MEKLLLDTNILMDFPEILLKEQVVISKEVRKELDNLKTCGVRSKEKKASRALRWIYDRMDADNVSFDNSHNFRHLPVDDFLINLAKRKHYILCSNDYNVLTSARKKKVSCCRQVSNEEPSEIVVLDVVKDEELVSKIYLNENVNFLTHQFIYIVDNGTVVDIFRQNENGYVQVRQDNYIYLNNGDKIRARNHEQECLMNLLFDPTITILYAGGSWGKGKSYLLTTYALSQLEKGRIEKIVWVTNNSQVDNSREVAALPGTLFEKELAYMGTLVDIIGMKQVQALYETGKLEIMPISLARGRSLNNAIVIANEAENLTNSHVKLLVSRCGEKTRIFFDGDYRQTDLKAAKEKSGLKLLSKLSESKDFRKIFGKITLVKSERSFTAQAADYLDSIEE